MREFTLAAHYGRVYTTPPWQLPCIVLDCDSESGCFRIAKNKALVTPFYYVVPRPVTPRITMIFANI